ncbi:DUF7504 family protein [Salinirubrum litoreum]|uniref:Uncharacterized protein n=1 Tax=Salinirubrum litoreum TaxID=1126234 RepID=A0ABD5RCX6_9EURY|nr:hypothetical protein [Salinirubrum litoreum]
MAPLHDRLPRQRNVLLLSESLDSTSRDTGFALLTPAETAATRVLVISYLDTPADWLDRWADRVGDLPTAVRLVTVGEMAAGDDDWQSAATGNVEVTRASPTDLTGVGIAVSDTLSAWAETDDRVVVCVDSVTTMLQYAPLATVFRFLHTICRRFASVEALAHFHLDPTAHDDQTVARLTQLFDSLVRVEDGDVTLRA